jgi:2-oxoglutarate dehydrogenase E1 component
MDKYSYISNADVGYIDQLYQNYKKDPASVDVTWQRFFEGYDFSSKSQNGHSVAVDESLLLKETQVRNLIFTYRSFGHLTSQTNPPR